MAVWPAHRWQKLLKSFHNDKKGRFDISKVGDPLEPTQPGRLLYCLLYCLLYGFGYCRLPDVDLPNHPP